MNTSSTAFAVDEGSLRMLQKQSRIVIIRSRYYSQPRRLLGSQEPAGEPAGYIPPAILSTIAGRFSTWLMESHLATSLAPGCQPGDKFSEYNRIMVIALHIEDNSTPFTNYQIQHICQSSSESYKFSISIQVSRLYKKYQCLITSKTNLMHYNALKGIIFCYKHSSFM
jgi:hypothetical protein